MGEITDILKKAKDIISDVKEEYETLLEVEKIEMKYLPIYVEIITSMEECIEKFIAAENYNILNHHSLSFSIIHIIVLEMGKIQERMKEINDYFISSKSKCCINMVKKTGKPSYIKKVLDLNFKEIYKNLIALEELEEKIFGSSNRIEHPILRKAWLLSGVNQMNNSSIESIILQNNIYELLNKEIGDNIDNDYNWNQKIENLVNILDNTINKEDKILTITELNKISKELYKFENVKDLLDAIEKKEKENLLEKKEELLEEKEKLLPKKENKKILDPITKNILTTFKNKVELIGSDYKDSSKNRIKFKSNFPAKEVCEFRIPPLTIEEKNNNYQLYNIEIKMCAKDQGWGGTGHVRVRYTINGEILNEDGFSVNRNNPEIKNNLYKFIINSNDIKEDDLITLYILCPVWGGWKGSVESVSGEVLYQ